MPPRLVGVPAHSNWHPPNCSILGYRHVVSNNYIAIFRKISFVQTKFQYSNFWNFNMQIAKEVLVLIGFLNLVKAKFGNSRIKSFRVMTQLIKIHTNRFHLLVHPDFNLYGEWKYHYKQFSLENLTTLKLPCFYIENTLS